MTDTFMFDKPQSWQELLDSLTPEIYENLRVAVELGKWPNGDRLTPQQVELCLQAVIAWDQKNLPEHQRVGYIDRKKLKTSHCGDAE